MLVVNSGRFFYGPLAKGTSVNFCLQSSEGSKVPCSSQSTSNSSMLSASQLKPPHDGHRDVDEDEDEDGDWVGNGDELAIGIGIVAVVAESGNTLPSLAVGGCISCSCVEIEMNGNE